MAVLSHVGLRSVGVLSSIVHTNVTHNVTTNVTLGYLASATNVTLGLERSDGNATLPG